MDINNKFHIRKIQIDDYHKNYLELLSQLTEVGDVTYNQFGVQIELLKTHQHQIYVIEENKKIIATGTILIEEKIIHNCSRVAHIEDVVVDKRYRGLKLGKKMINFLVCKAKLSHCYKVLLDCDEKNVGFYEKCDFKPKSVSMAKYF